MKKATKRTSNLSILHIDNNENLQQEMHTHLKKIFSNVYQAFSGFEGLSVYKKNKPDIVLTDLNLLDKNSFEMIVEMKEINPNVMIVVLSYKNSDFTLLETIDLGIIALLEKPLHLTSLNRALQKIILLKPNQKKPVKTKKVETVKAKPIVKPTPIKPVVKTQKTEPKIPKIEPIITKPILSKSLEKTPILKKEKVQPTLKKTVIPKPIIQTPIIEPIIPQVIKHEEIKVEPIIKIEKPKKSIPAEPKKIQSPSALSILSTAMMKKQNTTCINNYKGLIIQNDSDILKVTENSFTLKVSKTQFIAILNEKQTTINVNHHHIQAKLIDRDKNKSTVTFANLEIIKFKPRDNANKRITVDKSFKASIGFDNMQIELIPLDISHKYIAVEVEDSLNLKINSNVDLTMGFEINGPSSLIVEKKFTKTFATGKIVRIQHLNNKQKIVIEHTIQKAGQNIYKKYLQEREIEIINEFKMKMKL